MDPLIHILSLMGENDPVFHSVGLLCCCFFVFFSMCLLIFIIILFIFYFPFFYFILLSFSLCLSLCIYLSFIYVSICHHHLFIHPFIIYHLSINFIYHLLTIINQPSTIYLLSLSTVLSIVLSYQSISLSLSSVI